MLEKIEMEITYRLGQKEDCEILAEFASTASDGIIDFMFHDLIPGVTPVQIVARNLENGDYPRSYKNTIVAEHKKKVVGMALSIPSRFHENTEEMERFFPADRLEHLKHFFSARVDDSLLLDTLCVTDSQFGTDFSILSNKNL